MLQSVHIAISLTSEKYTENYIVLLPLENEPGHFLGTCLYVQHNLLCFLDYLLSCIHNLIEHYLNLWVRPCLSFPEHWQNRKILQNVQPYFPAAWKHLKCSRGKKKKCLFLLLWKGDCTPDEWRMICSMTSFFLTYDFAEAHPPWHWYYVVGWGKWNLFLASSQPMKN